MVRNNSLPGRTREQLISFLEEKTRQYNQLYFIENDPVSVPHLFSRSEDIEVAAFFAALFAWGQRQTAIRNARRLMEWMDDAPYDFIKNASSSDLIPFRKFVHRTFNGTDCTYLISSLQKLFQKHGTLGQFFQNQYSTIPDLKQVLMIFRAKLFSFQNPGRTAKHIADAGRNASAKRLNLMLRWMVRQDEQEVDFGIWNQIPPSALFIPLDLHSGNVARKLGLLKRSQNDWKSVEELTAVLRTFDPLDPVKYDFALFGLGIFEGYANQ